MSYGAAIPVNLAEGRNTYYFESKISKELSEYLYLARVAQSATRLVSIGALGNKDLQSNLSVRTPL